MKKIYVIEEAGEVIAACDTICGAMDYLRGIGAIDYNEEASEYITHSVDTDYAMKKMESFYWEDNIYNFIEDKIYNEIEECCVGSSYTGNIVIKEIAMI